ncbi:MAG: UPF0149 family protein [Betaproteobacteria bacterium]|nr:UPF0149 family protein [Betaproteobacteria bacterium]
MSNSLRLKRAGRTRRPRTLTRQQLEDWLASLDPPAPGVSMIDGYLTALVVSPQFIPPEDWLKPILGERVTWADEGTIEATVRNTLFQRYSEIGATLSGGPRRYAPVFMRTDEGEVLIDDFADGFHFAMQLSIDDWKPFISCPEIGMAMVAILGHCTNMISQEERSAAITPEAAVHLAQSWEVVPQLVEMLHVELAGARNVEIR